MYPANFFSIFPPFPRKNQVFVAMSFDEVFQSRWENILKPGISNVKINGMSLEAIRVDIRKVSDSIITEILKGISESLLIIADVTSIDCVNGRSMRNANVLYEVGIAHSTRLPEEVLLFRSDRDEILFDIANVRVNFYEPDSNPIAARQLVEDGIRSAIKERDLTKNLAVGRATESLDYTSWFILAEANQANGLKPPVSKSMRDFSVNSERVRSISTLLNMGAIKAEYVKITLELLESSNQDKKSEDLVKYTVTSFGRALLGETANRMGMFNSEVGEKLEERFQQGLDTPL